MLGHVRVHAGRELVVHGADLVDGDAVGAHDRGTDLQEPVGVGHLGGPLERAVDEGGRQAGEVGVGHVQSVTITPRQNATCPAIWRAADVGSGYSQATAPPSRPAPATDQ